MSKLSYEENSKSKKGHTFVKKIEGLPALLVWVPLLIVNNYSAFQVKTRKSVHRTQMPPPNAIQKKGLYVTVTGIP